jgi:hypothetical protein
MTDIFHIEETIKVDEKQVTETQKNGDELLQFANSITVTDQASYQGALTFGQECEIKARAFEKFMEPQKKQAYDLWKSICKMIESVTSPFRLATAISSKKALAFKKAEDKRIFEETMKKQAAEQKRIDDEKLAKAAELEATGKKEEAARVLDEKIVPVVEIEKAPEGIKGVSTREKWVYEITDVSKIPAQFMMPDTKKIGEYARAMKQDANSEWLKVWDEGTTVFKSVK